MSLDIAVAADGVAEVVIDHPPVNAMSSMQFAEVARAFESIGRNPEVRVAILRAEGRCFCAGPTAPCGWPKQS